MVISILFYRYIGRKCNIYKIIVFWECIRVDIDVYCWVILWVE